MGYKWGTFGVFCGETVCSDGDILNYFAREV